MTNENERIFSGERSRDLWDAIKATAKYPDQAHDALYLLACRCQELEAKLEEAMRGTVSPREQGPSLEPDADIVPDIDTCSGCGLKLRSQAASLALEAAQAKLRAERAEAALASERESNESGLHAYQRVVGQRVVAEERAEKAEARIVELGRAWHSICVMLGWENDAPLASIETNLRVNRARLEAAESKVKELQDSMVSHFQRQHLEGDGPEIDRWRFKLKAAEAEVEQLKTALAREASNARRYASELPDHDFEPDLPVSNHAVCGPTHPGPREGCSICASQPDAREADREAGRQEERRACWELATARAADWRIARLRTDAETLETLAADIERRGPMAPPKVDAGGPRPRAGSLGSHGRAESITRVVEREAQAHPRGEKA